MLAENHCEPSRGYKQTQLAANVTAWKGWFGNPSYDFSWTTLAFSLPCSVGPQSFKLWNDLTDRAGPVADRRFHRFAELAKRAMILDDLEQRVIAKAGGADRFQANPAAADRFALGPHGAARI